MRAAHGFVASIVAIVLVMMFAPSGRGDEPKVATTQELKSDRERMLEKKIEQLETQNAELRGQITKLLDRHRQLNALRGTLVIPPKTPAPASPLMPQQSVPDNWSPREINGMTYYIIPLNAGQAKVSGTGVLRTPAR